MRADGRRGRYHSKAVALALVVTLLWSSSWVLIKRGLTEIPPLTFAGLRYTAAALLLLIYWQRVRPTGGKLYPRRLWKSLVSLGVLQFTLTQGAQFVALAHLPAQTTSLALSTTPVFVALFGMLLLRERVSPGQIGGIAVFILGGLLYLLPVMHLRGVAPVGVVAVLFAPIVNAMASIAGRYANQRMAAVEVTTASMIVGGATLLIAGTIIEGPPSLSAESWLLLIWLAVVNTAFAFTLWNRSLRILAATTSSTINNTMLIQIGLLSWLFLEEELSGLNVLGLCVATLGAIAASRRPEVPAEPPA